MRSFRHGDFSSGRSDSAGSARDLADPDMTVTAGQNPDLQVSTGFVMQPGPDAGGEIAPQEIAAKTDRNGIPRRFRS